MADPIFKRVLGTGIIPAVAAALVCGGCFGLRSRSVAAAVIPSPPLIGDVVHNGDFSDGLTGWETAGQRGGRDARRFDRARCEV